MSQCASAHEQCWWSTKLVNTHPPNKADTPPWGGTCIFPKIGESRASCAYVVKHVGVPCGACKVGSGHARARSDLYCSDRHSCCELGHLECVFAERCGCVGAVVANVAVHFVLTWAKSKTLGKVVRHEVLIGICEIWIAALKHTGRGSRQAGGPSEMMMSAATWTCERRTVRPGRQQGCGSKSDRKSGY